MPVPSGDITATSTWSLNAEASEAVVEEVALCDSCNEDCTCPNL
jgi:hypothetical protein